MGRRTPSSHDCRASRKRPSIASRRRADRMRARLRTAREGRRGIGATGARVRRPSRLLPVRHPRFGDLMSASVAIVFLILSAIWGSTWLFIKLGLEDLPPLTFAGVRFVIAAAVLYAFLLSRRVPLPRARRDWGLMAVTGLLAFTLNYGLLFWGEQYVSSGLAAVLQATIPAFGLVIAHRYLPGERITPVKVVGVLLGITGVGIIFSNQMSLH